MAPVSLPTEPAVQMHRIVERRHAETGRKHIGVIRLHIRAIAGTQRQPVQHAIFTTHASVLTALLRFKTFGFGQIDIAGQSRVRDSTPVRWLPVGESDTYRDSR